MSAQSDCSAGIDAVFWYIPAKCSERKKKLETMLIISRRLRDDRAVFWYIPAKRLRKKEKTAKPC